MRSDGIERDYPGNSVESLWLRVAGWKANDVSVRVNCPEGVDGQCSNLDALLASTQADESGVKPPHSKMPVLDRGADSGIHRGSAHGGAAEHAVDDVVDGRGWEA